MDQREPLYFEPHYFLSTHDFQLIKLMFNFAQRKMGSERISIEEAEVTLKKFGLPSNIQDLISEREYTQGLLIDLESFCRIFHFAKLKLAFTEIDEDGSGRIDSAELLHALEKLGYKTNAQQRQKMMNLVDKNGDDQVSFQEFRAYFEHIPGGSFSDIMFSWETSLAEKKIERVAQIFLESIKGNRIHRITVSQTKAAFSKLGMDSDVRDLMSKSKEEFGENLTFSQFCRLFHLSRLKSVYNELDTDKSGYLEANEISLAMKKLGHNLSSEQCELLIKSVDLNSDGVLSFEEFQAFFESRPVESLAELVSSWAEYAFTLHGFCVKLHPGLTNWQNVFVAGTAAITSRTLTAPLEVIKTMEASGKSLTMASSIKKMYSQAGIRGLFAGNGIHCLCIFPRAGITCFLNNKFLHLTPNEKQGVLEPMYRALCAGSAGLIATTLTYPFLLLQTRRIAYRQKYKNMSDLVHSIWKKEGAQGFFQGLSPALLELVPFLTIQITLLELGKQKAVERNIQPTVPVLFSLGAFTGIVAQTVVYPLTVIRTRMQLEVDDIHRYNGIPINKNQYSFQILVKNITRKKGLRGLFSGIFPTYLRIFPSVGISAIMFHKLKTHFLEQNERKRLVALY